MPARGLRPDTFWGFQAKRPPVGLVETKALPRSSTATQSEVCGQEIPPNLLLPAISVMRQERALPAGSVEARTFPLQSAATQKLVDGQEISVISSAPGSTGLIFQAAAPPDGSVEVVTSPF